MVLAGECHEIAMVNAGRKVASSSSEFFPGFRVLQWRVTAVESSIRAAESRWGTAPFLTWNGEYDIECACCCSG